MSGRETYRHIKSDYYTVRCLPSFPVYVKWRSPILEK